MKTNRKRIFGIVAVIALVAILGACLVACNGASNYASKLAKKGYHVTVSRYEDDIYTPSYVEIPDGLSEGSYEYQIEWVLSAYRIEYGRYDRKDEYSVTIFKYKTKKAADEAYDNFTEEIYEDYQGSYSESQIVQQKGNLVFVGDRDAIEDAM